MKPLLFYFAEAGLASGVLYGYYHFFLRNNKFHQYNRFYLLASTILSLVIPLLRIDIYFTAQQDIPVVYQLLAEVRAGNTNHQDTASFFNGEKTVQLVYCLVASLFVVRFTLSLIRIVRLRMTHHAERLKNISFINTREKGTPFSFFRWLFWNENVNAESTDGKIIFHHELFHIRQKHSWDIIYLELLTTFFWINPFFHLIKKETKAIHEFLADDFAAAEDNKWEYAELLMMQALQTRQRLVNPFFHNQIKRRIAMITNSSKSSYQYLRKVMVLPLTFLLISVIAVNCSSKDTNDESSGKDNKVWDKTEIEPSFKEGNTGWAAFLQKNLNANVPVDHGAPEGTYKVMTQFIVDKNGKISDLKALTHFGFGMEEEVLRVMKLSPDWSPAIQDGHTVKAYRKQPITFVISSE